ncbi:MAG: hydrogen gas-evolving membrane-bound hydrogenase subunit E [Verrucomicrobiales bacterium]
MFAFIAVLVTGALLLSAVEDFPVWGDPHSLTNQSPVSHHYITESLNDTEVPNVVSAVLADYRGYDTMFETVVIFTGGIAIIAILRGLGANATPISAGETHEKPNLIVKTTSRIIMPVIQLFALYVVAHGHHSPAAGSKAASSLGRATY